MIRDTSNQDMSLGSGVEPRRLRRWGVGVVLLLALGLGVLGARRWGLGERSVDRQRVRIAEVTRGKLVRDIVADGRVTAANNPTLYAEAAGIITFRVRAGDAAKRGQPLAEIDSPELASQLGQERALMASLETEAERADILVQQGSADALKRIDEALLNRKTAARELERYRFGYRERLVPELDMLRAEDALERAEILVSHARGDQKLSERALGFERRTKRLALDRQRVLVRELERQAEALLIRSPVDGQVGQLLVAQSANVATHAPVLRVVDLTAFELEIQVPDSFARDLAIGMPAQIGAGNVEHAARVRSVAPEVVGGEVASRLEFSGKPPEGLRQNQRLTARILLDEKPDTLLVERGPSLEPHSSRPAYLVHDDIAERRPLITGAAGLDKVEILSGASAGDQLVISGADSLDDAESIRLSAR
ncbi:MAG TPA: HlyD family efflux transporter periplasmic adaptor subunit [Polyangiaceae bacterium]|nr:HlyD family efflux transporter periplasmic adaptor subunit [Polyangiaceae bacterium]